MTEFARLLVAPVLNSLPEGLLLALGAWLLLRLMRNPNSGTRFAVWLTALAGVVALPVLSSLGFGSPFVGSASQNFVAPGHSEFTVPDSWAMAFLLFWTTIASLALARVAAGLWQVRRLRRNCREVAHPDLAPELQDALRHASRRVRLLVSDQARVPAAIGFLRPAIVLPSWALDELSPAELHPILIHELEHLRRHDDWTNLAQKAARAVLFFHPAIWWIDARLSEERELACDDAVLAATGNPRAYAGCLIDLLERGCARRGWTMAQALVARAHDASVRIARILRSRQPATTRIGRAALGGTAILSFMCSGMAILAPTLVGFAPAALPVSAHLTEPLANDIHFPAAPVLPAEFHPGRHPAALRKTVVTHQRARRTPEVRTLMATRRDAPPVVMAGLNVDSNRMTDRPRTSTSAQAATEPVYLLYRHQKSDTRAVAPAALRPAATPGQGIAAMQIQMVQIVQQGRQVQIIRLVLIVPAQALRAQSI